MRDKYDLFTFCVAFSLLQTLLLNELKPLAEGICKDWREGGHIAEDDVVLEGEGVEIRRALRLVVDKGYGFYA